MEITLLTVGKLRPDLRGVADDYIRRLERHVKFHEVGVKEASRAPTVESQRNEEAKRLDSRRPVGSTLVALARSGSAWSSEDLARELRSWQCFCIRISY